MDVYDQVQAEFQRLVPRHLQSEFNSWFWEDGCEYSTALLSLVNGGAVQAFVRKLRSLPVLHR